MSWLTLSKRKYTINFESNPSVKQRAVFTGNHLKSMHLSLEASLKKLRTSYVDILYVHWLVDNTNAKELTDEYHNLGGTSTPASKKS